MPHPPADPAAVARLRLQPGQLLAGLRGEALVAVIAEVSNTYGDRHSYLCQRPDFAAIGAGRRARRPTRSSTSRRSWRSPGSYDFSFDIRPRPHRDPHRHRSGGPEGLVATLAGDRRPLTAARSCSRAVRGPSPASAPSRSSTGRRCASPSRARRIRPRPHRLPRRSHEIFLRGGSRTTSWRPATASHRPLAAAHARGPRPRLRQRRDRGGDELHDWSVVTALIARGDIGLGESYVAGLWDTPSIEALSRSASSTKSRCSATPSRASGTGWSSARIDRVMRAQLAARVRAATSGRTTTSATSSTSSGLTRA